APCATPPERPPSSRRPATAAPRTTNCSRRAWRQRAPPPPVEPSSRECGSSGHLQRAAERRRARSVANPDVAVDRPGKRSVLFAERPVVGAEIREVRRRIVAGRARCEADVVHGNAQVVEQRTAKPVVDLEPEEVAPRALPEVGARRIEADDPAAAEVGLQLERRVTEQRLE